MTLPLPALLAIAATSFGAGLAATVAVQRLAERAGLMDQPDDDRKQHVRAVPRLGGVGIAVGLAGGLAMAAVVAGPLPGLLALAVGSAAVFVLGLYDDLNGLGFKRRFVVQVLVAYGMFLAGWRIDLSSARVLDALGTTELAALSLPLTLLWTVGLINALNLIDGLDGLAGGLAVVGLASLALALGVGDPTLVVLCVAAGAATLGFLLLNAPPASIFMGDGGSTLLGFLLAMAGLRGISDAPSLGLLVVPPVVLALPLLDTLTAMVRRALAGQSPFLPDADHLHHRVLARSASGREALGTLLAMAVAFGAMGVLLGRAAGHEVAQAIGGLGAVGYAVVLLRQLEYFKTRVVIRKAQRNRNHRLRRRQARAASHDVSGDGLPSEATLPALPPGTPGRS